MPLYKERDSAHKVPCGSSIALAFWRMAFEGLALCLFNYENPQQRYRGLFWRWFEIKDRSASRLLRAWPHPALGHIPRMATPLLHKVYFLIAAAVTAGSFIAGDVAPFCLKATGHFFPAGFNGIPVPG